MPIHYLLVLALTQGITEFLPISSSAHLILAWQTFEGAAEQYSISTRLTLDVAVHVGTLLAVCLYFWRDLFAMVLGGFNLLRGRGGKATRLVIFVIVASVPLFAAGYLLQYVLLDLNAYLRGNNLVLAWATIGFGVLLFIADRTGLTVRRIEHLTFGAAAFVGLLHMLALIPGASRSGVTMTAARFLGFERGEAARFALLLGIPAILGAGTLIGLDLYQAGNVRLGQDALIGALLAFVSAFLAIALMMRWLRRASFLPFVIYRLLLGAALLILIYKGWLPVTSVLS